MNLIKIQVTGKNVENFIKRLNSTNIEMIDIIYINYKKIYIKIKKEDLEKVLNLKTIYEIEVVQIYGIDKLKYNIKKNKYIIIALLIGMSIIILLSNMIFSIDVIHSNSQIRKLITEELEELGIKKYSFKKSYKQIQKIKAEILNKYKTKIEWLEIENVGTKYIVRIEERIITNEDNNNQPRNVVAKKDAIILDIDASKGEVSKNINDYVKKGDIIISGSVKLYDEIKNNVRADGTVYGEVWYKVNVEFPFNYYEEKEISESKKIINIEFINKKIKLFYNKTTKIIDSKTLLKSNLLPIKLTLNTEKQIEIIDKKYSLEEARKKAIELAYDKIKKNLTDDEKILKHLILKEEKNDNAIILELFVAVKENITDYSDIVIEENIVN